MSNDFNLLEFADISDNRPWEVSPPSNTDLRAVVRGEQYATIEHIGKAVASSIGESIEAEEIEPPDNDIPWSMRVKVSGIPADFILWAEPLLISSQDATGIREGWVLALQTTLHNGDPLTHFSNLIRLLGNLDIQIESVCDLSTGRWFPKEIIRSVFFQDDIEPPEEVLWITRVVEAPEGGDPEDRWAWVTTHGLHRCGRSELEILGLPVLFSTEAVQLVDGLAALTFETPLPKAGRPISLGSDLLISLMESEKAILLLQEGMPGREPRSVPSVVLTSHNGTSVFPLDALSMLKNGKTAVMKTLRSTNRQATLAKSHWDLFVKSVKNIGTSEHATCLAQVPWSHAEDEDSPREYLWFRIIASTNESLIGELAHTPALITSLEEGHQEEISRDDITDWVVMTPVGPMGPTDADAIESFLDQFTH